eukprot:2758096-Pleurochrysis_carterae.AAC.2
MALTTRLRHAGRKRRCFRYCGASAPQWRSHAITARMGRKLRLRRARGPCVCSAREAHASRERRMRRLRLERRGVQHLVAHPAVPLADEGDAILGLEVDFASGDGGRAKDGGRERRREHHRPRRVPLPNRVPIRVGIAVAMRPVDVAQVVVH